MTIRPATDSSVIPTAITVFAVALGAVIAFATGRDPFLLYLIAAPFPVLLLWLARGAVQGSVPVAPAVITVTRGVDVRGMPAPAMARAKR